MKRRRKAMLAVLLLPAALGSCGDDQGESVEPGGSPTEQAVTTTTPGAWTLTATGLGPYEVGMSVTDAQAASGSTLDLGHFDEGSLCFDIDLDEPAGAWLRASVPEGETDPGAGTISVVGLLEDSAAAGVSTDTELQVGDTLADVEEVYGAALEISDLEYSPGARRAVVAEGTDHAVVFVIGSDDVIGAIQAGLFREARVTDGCA